MYKTNFAAWLELNGDRLLSDGIALDVKDLDNGAIGLSIGVGSTKGELTLSTQGELNLVATGPTPRHPAPAPDKILFSDVEMLEGPDEVAEAINAFVDTLSMLRPQGGCTGGRCS